MKRFVILIIFALSACMHTDDQTPSQTCTGTQLEQLMCKNPDIDTLDQEVQKQYQNLIKKPENKYLEKEHAEFLKNRPDDNTKSLKEAYEYQLKYYTILNEAEDMDVCEFAHEMTVKDMWNEKRFKGWKILDINHDGTKEYITYSNAGSMNWPNLYFFKETAIKKREKQSPETKEKCNGFMSDFEECYSEDFIRLFSDFAGGGYNDFIVFKFKGKDYIGETDWVLRRWTNVYEFNKDYNYRIKCKTSMKTQTGLLEGEKNPVCKIFKEGKYKTIKPKQLSKENEEKAQSWHIKKRKPDGLATYHYMPEFYQNIDIENNGQKRNIIVHKFEHYKMGRDIRLTIPDKDFETFKEITQKPLIAFDKIININGVNYLYKKEGFKIYPSDEETVEKIENGNTTIICRWDDLLMGYVLSRPAQKDKKWKTDMHGKD